jgi:uncharacterized protein (UPF0333 family)
MNTRINKGRLIIVILIGIVIIRSLLAIVDFSLTDEAKKQTTNKNVSIIKETNTPVATPIVTDIKKTKEPVITENKNKITLISYNTWAQPKVTKLTNIFNNITLHSSQNNLTAVLNDFDELFKIEKQFINKEYPKEFESFRYNMLQMFLQWHSAKSCLLINDSTGISNHGSLANNYLDLATLEYKKIMGLEYE